MLFLSLISSFCCKCNSFVALLLVVDVATTVSAKVIAAAAVAAPVAAPVAATFAAAMAAAIAAAVTWLVLRDPDCSLKALIVPTRC